MQTSFRGVIIELTPIISVESSQQTIHYPRGTGELKYLPDGRPVGLLLRLRDGLTVEINSGTSRLKIESGDSPST